MKIKELLSLISQPALYSKGTHTMWTDPHISEQLQGIHLNPDIDLASRKRESVDRTLDWMSRQFDSRPLDILELGCGPGLYTQRLAERGHRVTGADFSLTSLKTAERRAAEKELPIRYILGDYLELEWEPESFDAVFIVFTDFGVLTPPEQNRLLQKIYRVLKPGGCFLFDVLRDVRMEEKVGSQSWEVQEKGFWSSEPHLVLHNSISFLDHKAILERHAVVLERDIRTYYFWIRFYSEGDLELLLSGTGFENISFSNDVLALNGLWNGDNVLFCRANKPG